jgi:ankyrin repeat protein
MKLFNILEKHQAVSSAQNNKLDTPLHIAAHFNNVDFLVKYLALESSGLIASATPSIQTVNKAFFTPLQVAIAQNNQKCFDKLVRDANAKMFAKASSGSVYHVCAEYSNVVGLKYLLANQYAKNPSMFTTKNR